MPRNLYFALIIRVICITAVLILGSLVVDNYLTGLFGDYTCNNVTSYHCGAMWGQPHTHWGARHWYFFFGVLVLFVINIVDLIAFVSKKIEGK